MLTMNTSSRRWLGSSASGGGEGGGGGGPAHRRAECVGARGRGGEARAVTCVQHTPPHTPPLTPSPLYSPWCTSTGPQWLLTSSAWPDTSVGPRSDSQKMVCRPEGRRGAWAAESRAGGTTGGAALERGNQQTRIPATPPPTHLCCKLALQALRQSRALRGVRGCSCCSCCRGASGGAAGRTPNRAQRGGERRGGVADVEVRVEGWGCCYLCCIWHAPCPPPQPPPAAAAPAALPPRLPLAACRPPAPLCLVAAAPAAASIAAVTKHRTHGGVPGHSSRLAPRAPLQERCKVQGCSMVPLTRALQSATQLGGAAQQLLALRLLGGGLGLHPPQGAQPALQGERKRGGGLSAVRIQVHTRHVRGALHSRLPPNHPPHTHTTPTCTIGSARASSCLCSPSSVSNTASLPPPPLSPPSPLPPARPLADAAPAPAPACWPPPALPAAEASGA